MPSKDQGLFAQSKLGDGEGDTYLAANGQYTDGNYYMERTKELLGSNENLDRLIIQYSDSSLKLENALDEPVVLQRYTRIEYPWSKREKYSKSSKSSLSGDLII